MQEAKVELQRRIAALKRSIESCQEQKAASEAEIAELDQRIETEQILATQFQTVVDSLPES